jgi:hypothetical protein
MTVTGSKATRAVVHHKNAKANFVRIADITAKNIAIHFLIFTIEMM